MSKTVAEAKKLLHKHNIRAVKPGQLHKISVQLNRSLMETLNIIAFLKSGGQGTGPFPYTQRALRGRFI